MAFLSAPVCPHCGRSNERSRFPLEIAGGAVLAAICVAALALGSGTRDATLQESAPAKAPETLIAQPYRTLEHSLSASIGYNRALHLFRIENRDPFSWTNCQLSLNSHGISSFGLAVDAISAGLTEAALVQSTEFTDDDGRRFDPATTEVARLDLDCETPHGHRYYGGKFGPDTLRAR
jgi:hypothetical protein